MKKKRKKTINNLEQQMTPNDDTSLSPSLSSTKEDLTQKKLVSKKKNRRQNNKKAALLTEKDQNNAAPNLNLEEKKQIESIIAQSLLTFAHERALDHYRRKLKQTDLKFIANNMQEYFNSFLVLGFDCNDEPVVIEHSPTNKDIAALNELLKHLFIRRQAISMDW